MSSSDVDLSDGDDLIGDDPDYEAEAKRPTERRAGRAATNTPEPESDRHKRGSEELDPQQAGEQLSAYELERAQRVEANKKRLAELVQVPPSLASLNAQAAALKRPRQRQRVPLAQLRGQAPSRGSARIRGESAPAMELDERDNVLDASTVATTETGELVTYSACHCCRQTTSKYKAVCTSEGCSLQWCHHCLNNKEGESAEAANASGTWRCPLCVGGVANCLCSMCRRKAGKSALGPLWPVAQAEGFTSVRAFITARGIS